MKKFQFSFIMFGLFAGLGASAAHAVLPGINDPSFEGPAGPLTDSGGVNKWSSFGVNSPWAITADVVHTGLQSITNTDGSGFSLLYGYETTSSPLDILGQKFDYSFWVYYDATLPGQSPSTDSVGYDFSARDDINDDAADSSGTVTASSLTSKTWTQITGVLDVTSPGLTTDLVDRLGSVLIAPAGKWYADDFSLTPEVTPEPASLALLGIGVAGVLVRRKQRA